MIKGIILAAGRGSRLKAKKKSQPKCFTKINNKHLIDYQIEALSKNGVDEIYIVTGFKKFFFKKKKKKNNSTKKKEIDKIKRTMKNRQNKLQKLLDQVKDVNTELDELSIHLSQIL